MSKHVPGFVTVTLSEPERERLCKGVVSEGGGQSLLHRLQRGLRGRQLTVRAADLPAIARVWNYGRRPGRKATGGFQTRMPVRALAEYLPTSAPLFGAVALPPKEAVRYVYYRVIHGDKGRIKIGGGYTTKRRDQVHSTDQPDRMITLLKLEERPGETEKDHHRRWSRFIIPPEELEDGQRERKHEWFFFVPSIRRFIDEESAKQKLSE